MGAIRFKGNTYACAEDPENDISEKEVTFETEDELEPEEPSEAPLVQSGPIKNIIKTLSTIGKNTRYLLKMLGTTDISQLGDGTVTGAIETLGNRNVKLTGDVVGTGELDDNGDIEVNGSNKLYIIGANGISDNFVKKWFKIADSIIVSNINITTKFEVISIVNNTTTEYGNLTLNVVSTPDDPVIALSWDYAGSKIDLNSFIAIYKIINNQFYISIYVKPNTVWHGYLIKPIYKSFFAFYDSDIGEDLPSEYIQVASSLATIKNPISGMAKNVTITGDVTGSGTFDAEGNVSVNTRRRGCIIYKNGGALGKKYKVLELDVPLNTWNDVNIILRVSDIFSSNSYNKDGLLKIHLRPATSEMMGYAQWIYANSNLSIGDFVLAYKNSSVKLYFIPSNNFVAIRIILLDAITLLMEYPSISFFNTFEESIPSDYTQVTSTLATIQNPVINRIGGFFCTEKKFLNTTDNLNNCTDITAQYFSSLGYNPINSPVSNGGFTLYNISHNWGIMQFAIEYESTNIHIRNLYIQAGNRWSSWKTL